MAVQVVTINRKDLKLSELLKVVRGENERAPRSLNLILPRGTRFRAIRSEAEKEDDRSLIVDEVISAPGPDAKEGAKTITSYAALFEIERRGRKVKEFHRVRDFIRFPVDRPKDELYWHESAAERILSSSIWSEEGESGSELDALQRVLSGRWITVKEVIRPQGHQFGKDWCYLLELDPKK